MSLGSSEREGFPERSSTSRVSKASRSSLGKVDSPEDILIFLAPLCSLLSLLAVIWLFDADMFKGLLRFRGRIAEIPCGNWEKKNKENVVISIL
jgi:hypothetical protein